MCTGTDHSPFSCPMHALCLPTCGHKIIIAGKCSMNGRGNFQGCSLCATPNNATWETFTLLGIHLPAPFPLDFPQPFPPHFTLLRKVNGYTRRNSWPQFMGHVTLPRPKNNAIETLTSVGQRSYVKYNSSTRNSKLPTASRSITLKVSSCLTSQQESAYLPGERAFLTGLMCRNFQI